MTDLDKLIQLKFHYSDRMIRYAYFNTLLTTYYGDKLLRYNVVISKNNTDFIKFSRKCKIDLINTTSTDIKIEILRIEREVEKNYKNYLTLLNKNDKTIKIIKNKDYSDVIVPEKLKILHTKQLLKLRYSNEREKVLAELSTREHIRKRNEKRIR